MGIRFLCPNGHKLNVKSFLAGKKGVCPQCGARMRIPQQSDPALRKPGDSDANDDLEQESEPMLVGGDGPATAAATPGKPAAAGGAATGSLAAGAVKAAALAATPVTPQQLAAVSVVPRGVAVTPAVVEPSDPFSEAPNAVWYVRPPAGGQYGPARTDVMKRWISEGRVTSDSYVWREGWPDWRMAVTAIPGFRTTTSSGSLGLDRGSATAAEGTTDATSGSQFGPLTTRSATRGAGSGSAADSAAAARVLAARRKSNTGPIIAMVILGLMAIVLTVALVAVLRSN
ncbi:MAG: DUF4339 domain-containing protein [Planctomycetota bacterium]